MMRSALPINLTNLLHHRTEESERVEYKAGWNPESILHTLCAFTNDFHNLGGGYGVVGVEASNGFPQSNSGELGYQQYGLYRDELLNFSTTKQKEFANA